MKSDAWLPKNIRPLTLIFLTTVFVILSVFDGNLGEFSIGEAYVPVYQTLLMTVYAAYFTQPTLLVEVSKRSKARAVRRKVTNIGGKRLEGG